jgi:hypothetical protein
MDADTDPPATAGVLTVSERIVRLVDGEGRLHYSVDAAS